MYYSGLLPKFKVNRPLLEEERESHLPTDKALNIEPTSALSVTRVNSTYLEVTDKFYPWKGFSAFLSLTIFFMMVIGGGAFFYTAFIDKWEITLAGGAEAFFALTVIYICIFSGIGIAIWFSRLDCFRYTHYPIRLNRKNRKVYVFRQDGTVLETPWDDLFITIEPAAPGRTFVDGWDLRAHVMAGDGETVLETFAFGYISDPDNLRHYFEYLRLYMDEGPQAIAEHTPYCLNIVEKKETPVFGFKRLLVDFSYIFFMILMFIPVFFIAIGRVFAMATCKIPRWPIEVEAACPIEKGDPWVRDASTHPAK